MMRTIHTPILPTLVTFVTLFAVFTTLESLVIPLPAATSAESLKGVVLERLCDGERVDLGEALSATVSGSKTMIVAASHTADFNTIEYGQQIRFYWDQMKEKGIERCLMVMNGQPSSCAKLQELLDLPEGLEIFPDSKGTAGRSLGVSRGFAPDNADIPASWKVTVVGFGFGPPWGTLPAVLTGYFGNPNGHREWIEASLRQGQLAGRWPKVLELDDDESSNHAILANKFDNFPLVSGWGRRPFELATLRLQNILDIQIKFWQELKPVHDPCLTQLGGCMIVGENGVPLFSWVDRGLCNIPDMKKVLEDLN